MDRSWVWILVVAVLLPAPRVGAKERRAEETSQNAAEALDDHRDTWDDRRDLNRLVWIIDDWTRAVELRDKALEMDADAALVSWISHELAESRHEVDEAKHEVDSSRQEVSKERFDTRRARWRGRRGVSGRGGHEVRDDARDLVDDKRDLQQAEVDLDRTRAIATELQATQYRFADGTASAGLYAQKRKLLEELRSMTVAELGSDFEEAVEDRGERKEDRRDN